MTNFIRKSKWSIYHNQIINSTSKIKTTWNIIKSVSGRQNEHKTSKYQNSPDSFNKLLLSIAKKISHNIKHSSGKDNSINNTSTRETERIINSLKLK